eukprot:gene8200-16859_t
MNYCKQSTTLKTTLQSQASHISVSASAACLSHLAASSRPADFERERRRTMEIASRCCVVNLHPFTINIHIPTNSHLWNSIIDFFAGFVNSSITDNVICTMSWILVFEIENCFLHSFIPETQESIALVNPSVFIWKGKTFYAWRVRDKESARGYDSTAIHVMNDELNISSSLQPLTVDDMYSCCVIISLGSASLNRLIGQDMRFIIFKDRLFAFFNHGQILSGHNRPYHGRKMYFNELVYNENRKCLHAEGQPRLLSMAHEVPLSNEKNWTPFEYGNRIYMIYSYHPFRIVQILPSLHNDSSSTLEHMVDTVSLSSSSATIWEWGTVRGGTPALLIGDKYLTFFHSSKKRCRLDTPVYFMGALTFSANPPFQILQISPEPLVTNISYNFDSSHRLTSRVAIVFPMSFLVMKDTILLTMGKDDKQGCIVEMYLQPLLQSLKNVSQITLGNSNWTNDKPVPHSFKFTCSQYFEPDYCDKLLRKSHHKQSR